VTQLALGFVKSLARPGGNITGLSTQAPELSGKRLELLKEIVPNLSRIAVLWQPGEPGTALRAKETEAVARSMGIKPQMIEVKAPAEFEGAFAEIKRSRAEALISLRSPLIGNRADKIIELAAINRVPVIYDEKRVYREWRLDVLWPGSQRPFSSSRHFRT
jgi:putative ABC transport system substrate-binding protein